MDDFWEKAAELPDELTPEFKAERERMVSLSLPIKYWMSTLAAVAHNCQTVGKRIKELQAQGRTEKDLNELQASALVGPIYVRSAIVELLAREGVVTAEGNAKVGFEWLMKMQEDGKELIRKRDEGLPE